MLVYLHTLNNQLRICLDTTIYFYGDPFYLFDVISKTLIISSPSIFVPLRFARIVLLQCTKVQVSLQWEINHKNINP
jgi:hypothetical protein